MPSEPRERGPASAAIPAGSTSLHVSCKIPWREEDTETEGSAGQGSSCWPPGLARGCRRAVGLGRRALPERPEGVCSGPHMGRLSTYLSHCYLAIQQGVPGPGSSSGGWRPLAAPVGGTQGPLGVGACLSCHHVPLHCSLLTYFYGKLLDSVFLIGHTLPIFHTSGAASL